MGEVVKAFGPSAIATPANAVTLVRLAAAPAFAVFVARSGPASWTLVVLWVLLSGSDGLDGFIARWHGTTRSGAFLDPLADKFLVLGTLAALAGIGEFGWLPVAIIAGRELTMSVFRIAAGRRGISVPARTLAKVKTLAQDLAILLALVPPLGLHHVGLVRDVLWFAVALTVASGLEYYRGARRQQPRSAPPIEVVAEQRAV